MKPPRPPARTAASTPALTVAPAADAGATDTDTVRIILPDDAATMALGRALAPALGAGDAVLLRGDLGAGKTTLARALLRTLCDDAAMEVPSPSYTLVQTYDAPGVDASGVEVSHFDLWRLDGPDALVELGWDDACEGIVLVEWPDRLGALAPPDARGIELTVRADGGRDAILRGWGAHAHAAARMIQAGGRG
ncbi:tRNA (adenosine(37)-N6)-threonylcarbamoyltransferase complex ATPase subunit type 1 TsaE [Novacetimonas cocois]|uniref:tRNA threonylcarbamoyladenosine biosynthesis protein TsaE n=1 Tax=Novacetimonas cocois TaxID=1747507 RepID=A0A365YXE6_9PROT|nr:tRNA (adenosine(37)-N6)-threonylcarbamoyltransferase complex ATPase subunit type 1 TsaE [Novacetimonas cocois]RBM07649.1 tRNA (adenosine(37)-N6)-threonylcarbamoyltransferase complex ATPase subunit type 1 TsaE [Novacetimonas cocois]